MVTALLVAFIVLVTVSVASWFVLYQLVKQRGRLLLRLDGVEQRLREVEQRTAPATLGIESAQADAHEIPVGTRPPDFQLPDLAGQTIGLGDFRDQRVLLVHWNPLSDFCKLMASELAELQSDFRSHKARLVLVSAHDREPNLRLAQEHGLECPILLFPPQGEFGLFHNVGTPAAYLLDEEGLVIYPRALGVEQVLVLAREAVSARMADRSVVGHRSLSASRIEREGLKAGTPAPSFKLPTIYGETISLEEFRGRRVLLVFTSPHCAPCDHLAPHLVRLNQQHQDDHLALLMIGRGDTEENRLKAEAHGVRFPVALQKHWEISRLYGIFVTPVAFLIDETGVIAKNVAKGTDQILALAREQPVAEQRKVSDEQAV